MLLSFRMRSFCAAAMSLIIVCFSAAVNFAQMPVDSAQITGADDPRFPGATVFAQRSNNFAQEKLFGNQSSNQRQNDFTDFAPADARLDPAFAPAIDSFPGSGSSTALQPDGKILVGGSFKNVNGLSAKNIVRLNQDYSIDQTFNAATNSTVLAIAVQPNGKILIGGFFTSVNGASRNYVARLNADGSLDTDFNIGFGADNAVYDIKIQTDGKILLGGNFIGVNSTNNHAIARLNADGSVDTSFTSPYAPLPPFSSGGEPTLSTIFSLAVQPDGKIVVVGDLWRQSDSSYIRRVIARLSANGANDSSFTVSTFVNQARAVALQSNGKILLGGVFTNGLGSGRTGIARFNSNGSNDASFNTANNANMYVYSISVLPDDSIYIGGSALFVNGTVSSSVLRMSADGVRDDSFAAGSAVTSQVNSVLPLPNNQVLTAGFIPAVVNGPNRNSIAVFNANGSLDTAASFSTAQLGSVIDVARQTDGGIIVGGTFTRVNGVSRDFLARFNANGSLDTNFPSGVGVFGSVTALLIQPDGKIIVGGFSLFVGNTSRSIIRLNADGTVDNSFTQGMLPSNVFPVELARQPDGKIVVIYAAFDGFNRRGGIARLNQDGSLDSSFSNGGSPPYNAVAVQPDGKILVGGQFIIIYPDNNTPRDVYSGIIRLNQDGTHDRAFRPATSNANNQFSAVYSISVRPDGKVLIGGNVFPSGASASAALLRLNQDGTRDASFNTVTISNSPFSDAVEKFAVLPNGKIVIGGFFSTIDGLARRNAARLNADGSLDAAFIANTDNAVLDLELQNNNQVLLSGSFETVNNQPRTALARLFAGSTAYDFDGDARADLSVFRPSEGNWYFLRSGSNSSFGNSNWGLGTDKLAPADYDGDGRTDFAVWRDEPTNPQRANFYILNSSNNTVRAEQFGASGDQPTPNDWDGDGKADLGVYRAGANNTQSRFFYRPSLQPNVDFVSLEFGLGDDKPVVGDYDADGRQDAAVFRPSNSGWYILQSSNSQVRYAQWGLSADKLVPADYDGDGKTDLAVFRDGIWYVLQSSNNQPRYEQWGLSDDVPVAADYDGDGQADVAVWRASTGVWWLRQSQSGFAAQQWGTTGDVPIPAAFLR